MASILDEVKVSSYVSEKTLKATNKIRSNQYVHDYYHIAKSVLPKGLTDGIEVVDNTITDTITGIMVQTPWRRKLTRDRLAHAIGFEQINPIKDAISGTVDSISKGVKSVSALFNLGLGFNTRANRKSREGLEKIGSSVYTPLGLSDSLKANPDIINITHSLDNINTRASNKPNFKVYILNSSANPYQYIELQNRPSNIRVSPETSWAVIRSMGRNVPMYHFTGAEDTIEFNISWYQDSKEHADDVINKCRLLESWSKANGYVSGPPFLQIIMGNDGPFDNQYFILSSASYELSNFGLSQYSETDGKAFKDSYKNPRAAASWGTKYYPTIARQTLVFKRISDTNPTWNDIIPNEKLQYTSGVKLDLQPSQVNTLKTPTSGQVSRDVAQSIPISNTPISLS